MQSTEPHGSRLLSVGTFGEAHITPLPRPVFSHKLRYIVAFGLVERLDQSEANDIS